MRISGTIEDAGVAEVMQVIHLGGRSGRLVLEKDAHRAELDFVLGRVVAASSDAVEPAERILERWGEIAAAEVRAAATQLAAGGEGPKTLSEVLLATEKITPRQWSKALVEQVESVIVDVVGWKHGTFAFHVSAAPAPPSELVSTAPHRLLPTLDTQKLILEAVRRQAAASTSGGGYEDLGKDLALDRSALGPHPADRGEVAVLQVVSTDRRLAADLAEALGEEIEVSRVGIREAGATPPGADAVLVLLDLRGGVQLEEIGLMARRRPRAIPIALTGDNGMITAAFLKGAAIALPYDLAALTTCIRGLLARRLGQANPDSEKLAVGRILRFLEEIRSGVYSATMSLSLMSVVSEYAERGVLFVPRRGAVHAIGAFGLRIPGPEPLAEALRNTAIPLAAAGGLREALERRRLLRVACNAGSLSAAVAAGIGAPATGEGVVIPVIGRATVIALVYADNGTLDSELSELDVVEIAVSQAGLAFETELLQRRIETSPTFTG